MGSNLENRVAHGGSGSGVRHDGNSGTGPSGSRISFTSRLKSAAETRPLEDKTYPDLESLGYYVDPIVRENLAEVLRYNEYFPQLQATIKKDLGIDLGSLDTLSSYVRYPLKPEGTSPAVYRFYTSPSSKSFLIGTKYNRVGVTEASGPLPVKAIQQQAMERALKEADGDVKPADMKYFGEVGVENLHTKDLMNAFRAHARSGKRISFDSSSIEFDALSNSDNGRAEFGQLIDNMNSMGLTFDAVSTYYFEGVGGPGTYLLFWHTKPAF